MSPTPWTTPPNYTPGIYTDVFPATVTLSTGQIYPKSRAIVTADSRLFVFSDSPVGPVASLVAVLDPSSPADPLTITAPLSATATITPEGHCGCGSRLRSFVPFSQMRHLSSPAAR